MNDHALSLLEFYACLNSIAAHCASEPGRALLLSRRPDTVPARVEPWRRLFSAVRQMDEIMGGELPQQAFPDLSLGLAEAAPEGAVLPQEFFAGLALFCEHAASLRRFLAREQFRRIEGLAELASPVGAFTQLRTEMVRVFDERGEILDAACPELAAIRPALRQLSEAIRRKLDHILRSDSGLEVFAERFHTLRNGRHVLPLRREMRSRVRGIIHDESGTGRTIFIEPEDVVPMGNELIALRHEELKAIRQVLKRLTDLVRVQSAELATCQAALARYDTGVASHRWALLMRASLARTGGAYELHEARHPLLQQHLAAQQPPALVIPLDLQLTPAQRVLAITGSNTGGKTICLKTVGLLTLLHQAGLPVTARADSVFPFFEDVLADIGDEQSIAASLSTFSAHLKNLAHILKTTGRRRCLVLIDEMGSGTDPIEGGALSCAILRRLAGSGSITLLTTHIGMIKSFVEEQPSMINASVRFNRATLLPEYTLDVGIPGASHALDIAGRLHIEPEIIEDARSFLHAGHIDFERIIKDLDAKQRALRQDIATARADKNAALQERASLESQLRELRQQRRDLLLEAQQEAAQILENARRHSERLIRRLEGELPTEEARELRKDLRERRDAMREAVAANTPKPEQPLPRQDIKVGSKVWVERLQAHGLVKSISSDGRRLLVAVQGLEVNCKLDELGRPESAPESAPAVKTPPKSSPAPQEYSTAKKASGPGLEINLIGQRVEPALRNLEAFLAQAYGRSLPMVRIVHGRGTGQLRAAIHEFLRQQRYVREFFQPSLANDPSGDAVTIVEF